MLLLTSLLLSFLGGFVFLSYEMIWIRIFSIPTKSDPKVFGIVLAIYLLGIAISSLVIGKKKNVSLNFIGNVFLLSSVLCYLVLPGVALISTIHFRTYWYGLILVFLATLSFGCIFPLLVSLHKKNSNSVSRSVANVYTANILGSTLGPLVTGFVLFDRFSLADSSLVVTAICLLSAVVASLKSRSKISIAAGIIIFLVMIQLHPSLHKNLYLRVMYMARSKYVSPFKHVVESKSGVICVTSKDKVYSGGAYDGVVKVDLNEQSNPEIIEPFLLSLIHPRPKKVLQIGLATGAWAQVMVHNPQVESLTSIEINPGYLEVIKKYKAVSSILANSKMDIVIDDGRRWLRRNPDTKFDVIVMNTPFHWRSGVANLLSDEFMKMLKAHLKEGGVIYINTTRSKESARTVATNFKYVWENGIYLAASDSPFITDKEIFKQIIDNYTIDGKKVVDIEDKRSRRTYDRLMGIDVVDSRNEILNRTAQHDIITDDNMACEFN